MKCPDWTGLLAHRLDPDVPRPAGWAKAEEHLEQCAACRRTAVDIDPTLAFRAAARWAPADDEVREIQRAVNTLRRSVDFQSRTAEGEQRLPVQHIRRDRGPLVAAALFALLLALQPSSVSRSTGPLVEFAEPVTAQQVLPAARPAAPAIEGVDRPEARVYEWGADDLSVVMVVDESLDV